MISLSSDWTIPVTAIPVGNSHAVSFKFLPDFPAEFRIDRGQN